MDWVSRVARHSAALYFLNLKAVTFQVFRVPARGGHLPVLALAGVGPPGRHVGVGIAMIVGLLISYRDAASMRTWGTAVATRTSPTSWAPPSPASADRRCGAIAITIWTLPEILGPIVTGIRESLAPAPSATPVKTP